MQDTTVPLGVVSHDGTDVGIYATGPMSHLFHATHEQHYIYHVMAYAACLGDYQSHCNKVGGVAKASGYSSKSLSTSVHSTRTLSFTSFIVLFFGIALSSF